MTTEDFSTLLDKAAQICVSAHAGQRDKAGAPYFLHPMRVALKCETPQQKIVALLHDTIEDTNITPAHLLAQGFPQEIVDAILSVTKRHGESYTDFIARAKQNPIGRIVKLHDIDDNLNPLRLNQIDPEMCERFNKYLAARQALLATATPTADVKHQPAAQPLPSTDLKHKIFQAERHNINAALKRRLADKHDRPVNETLLVRKADGTILRHEHGIDTMIELIKQIGYEQVASLSIIIKNKYPLVTKTPLNPDYYKEATLGWHIFSHCSNLLKAYELNKITAQLNLPILTTLVPK